VVPIIQPIFTGSSYDTPENMPRRFMDRLFLNTRWYFVGGYLNEVLHARAQAVKGCYDDQAWVGSSYNILKVIEGCGGRIHLRGLDHLRSCGGPVVFVSNHMSTLETFVFPCIIVPFMRVTYVVKKSLVTQSLFGPVMRSRDPIAVSRKNPREDFEKVMSEGKKILAGGTSIIIFPQNSRMVEFIPEEFNTLGIKLARAAGVQVIPVAIKTDFWGNGRFLKDLGTVHRERPIHMVFGEPFSITGNGKEDHQRVLEFIVNNLREMGGVVKD
jgi:1-acyl-sn-glycerol-3-phosphate acyltransferase